MTFTELPEFAREYIRLRKRFLSLDEDFAKFKKVLAVLPQGTGGRHWNVLHRSEQVFIIKTRLACAYLRKNALRVIYAHTPTEKRIEFIEIYFKGDKETEDGKRIKDYLNKFRITNSNT
jgi:hypothetical protein